MDIFRLKLFVFIDRYSQICGDFVCDFDLLGAAFVHTMTSTTLDLLINLERVNFLVMGYKRYVPKIANGIMGWSRRRGNDNVAKFC